MKRQVGALCVAVLVTCASWSVVAGDKEEAKQLFDAGLKLMRLDDFAGATANFERSVALYPTQNSLFNLANCYKALQRYGDALALVERLKRDFGSKLKPEIKEAIERHQQELQSLVARLTLETVPADASIRIDGKEAGTGPTLGPLLLGPGEHEIEAARPGYRSQRRSVKLVSGAGRNEKFVLEVEASQVVVRANIAGAGVFVDSRPVGTTPLAEAISLPPGKHLLSLRAVDHEDIDRAFEVQAGTGQVLDIELTAKAPSTPVTAPAPPAPGTSLPESGPAKPRSRVLRIVTWSSAAGAVAAGVVAGTFLIIRNGQANDFQKYNDLVGDHGDPADRAKRQDAVDGMNRSKWIAIASGIGAGALAVTALVTYLLDSRREESQTTVSLSPFGLGVRF